MTLTNLRLSKKLSQEKLAALIGVARKTILRWEAGQGTPKALQAKQLAKALGCSIGDVITAIEQAKDKGAA